jgi:hypothetical protein
VDTNARIEQIEDIAVRTINILATGAPRVCHGNAKRTAQRPPEFSELIEATVGNTAFVMVRRILIDVGGASRAAVVVNRTADLLACSIRIT